LREELEYCGPEGVFIFEDDCFPLPGAEQLNERVKTAFAGLPGVEVIACHKPHVKFSVREKNNGAMRMLVPPWGSVLTWYSPNGLRLAVELLMKLDCPTDWIWRPLSDQSKFAMLDPPLAWHEVSDTTYIGNQYRGVSLKSTLRCKFILSPS
jgi:hypothetical protein